jgi:hypothetical protein
VRREERGEKEKRGESQKKKEEDWIHQHIMIISCLVACK